MVGAVDGEGGEGGDEGGEGGRAEECFEEFWWGEDGETRNKNQSQNNKIMNK